MIPEQKEKTEWSRRIRVVELLVDSAYHTPVPESTGLHKVKGLEFAEKLKVWKNHSQFPALTPEALRTIVEAYRMITANDLEDTFCTILKRASTDDADRKAYLTKFLPLVCFAQCTVTHHEPMRPVLSTVGGLEHGIAELARVFRWSRSPGMALHGRGVRPEMGLLNGHCH
ncbi:uncharacterized protein LOC125947279 [Dermacentor silvarum]|uniref:uncharacterized protein LOC125947279 n=1 Tax=Dermacentor silvarum TaxID=543639 RepID=UPI0021009279|nr:uncharacterized protein LOC125947279 [Dermacentor silvarum]